MASISRIFARAISKSSPHTSAFKTSARNTAFRLPRQTFRQQSRGYASEPSKSSSSGFYIGIGALVLGGAGYYVYSQGNGSLFSGSAGETKGIFTPKFEDYQKVYNEIAERLDEKEDYDDGSYGPVLLRLAWHASGTYDKETGTGGSNGATMRFAPEGGHGANAGLQNARDFLEPVKRACLTPLILKYYLLTTFAEKFPWITYSDLWILAGVVAIQEMQGNHNFHATFLLFGVRAY